MDRLPRRTLPGGGEGQGPVLGMPFNEPGMPGDVPRYGPGASPGYENPYITLQDYFTPEEFNILPLDQKLDIVKVFSQIGGQNEPPENVLQSMNPANRPIPGPVPSPPLSKHETPTPGGRPEPTPTSGRGGGSMLQKFLSGR